MSILGYVSALLHLMLSGHRFGQPQGGQTASPAPSPQPDASAAPATPSQSPQTEGLGQVGLVLESALGGGAAAPDAKGALQESSAQGKATSPPEAARKGLGTALTHAGNAHAQAVLAALLAKAAVQEKTAQTDITPPPEGNVSETEARRLAELRVDAHKREDILRRISNAAAPADQTTEAETQGRDPMPALRTQMTAFGAPQGAYSIFALAAINPEAGRGQGLRLTL